MDRSSEELDARFMRLSAETRARAMRMRKLEASSRRLKDEASELICCLHEARFLQDLMRLPGVLRPRLH